MCLFAMEYFQKQMYMTDPLYYITCHIDTLNEISKFLHNIGGMTSRKVFAHDKVHISAQLSDDTRTYLTLKYPGIKIEK
jgi:hypothetical protein